MARRDLALKLREARRQDSRLSMLNQYKQSMSAPDWEIDDYEWCAIGLQFLQAAALLLCRSSSVRWLGGFDGLGPPVR